MPLIEFQCKNCQKTVERYDSQANTYCSHACYIEDKNKIVEGKTCLVCQAIFTGKESQKYCSSKCKRKRDHSREKGEYEVICPQCGLKRVVIYPPKKKHSFCKTCKVDVAKQTRPQPKGSESYAWKGGRRVDTYGYVKLKKPGHPFSDSTGYVREHLFVVTEVFGEAYVREQGGVVHHINGNKQDNRIENLLICTLSENAKFNQMLLALAFQLVQNDKPGKIEFDRITRRYVLVFQEETP